MSHAFVARFVSPPLWLRGSHEFRTVEFSVAEAFDSERIIATADIPGLRLYAVQKNSSSTPSDQVIDLQYPQGWVRSSPATVCGAEYPGLNGYDPPHNTSAYCGHHCGPSAAVHSFARATWGYFSAVCYIYGRALLRETGRPQGLLESCWGGSPIESWSDTETLAKCPAAPDSDSSTSGSSHYNGMIFPFLRFPIRGAIWYQVSTRTAVTTCCACVGDRSLMRSCASGRGECAQCCQLRVPDAGDDTRLA